MADVTVEHNAGKKRYDALVDGEVVGFANYRQRDDVLQFNHTEVDPEFGGQGIGTQLVREALDQVRAAHQQVVPICPFVAEFIELNPEYTDLLVAEPGRAG